jgi:hypothetical protein
MDVFDRRSAMSLFDKKYSDAGKCKISGEPHVVNISQTIGQRYTTTKGHAVESTALARLQCRHLRRKEDC